ncbi:GMC oxidoreductase [Aquibium oceanicum]|uniref:Glucose-methanol-choline oxidoreductase C-terminal domain-containing protein n=1 Tax=Aquibium oceanicum TaxID=1670800 RepID=A0A1L3SVB6_9HYPH|nr:GMC family oxidoreductase [Aquibium oceanicum]APH73366.1 hypothetical protein BSQ44_19785 [Aquibium oceanicum]
MIRDAETIEPGAFRDRTFDVCIVGAGPAGITLARRLGAAGKRVGLFEGGGLEYEQASQEVYEGTTTGQPYYPLDGCRLRYFGGTSNHWGGWTRALEADDFEPRPHNPLSGWPIEKADLDPYAGEADDILNLPPVTAAPDVLPEQGDLRPQLFRFSRPTTRFGEKYQAELESSANIETYLNANLVDLRIDENGKRVTEAVFRTYGREEPFTVRASAFVLCLGGLENPRALLNANTQIAAGLGNEHDLVGRYFLEHPHAPVGSALLRDAPPSMLVYSPTPDLMRTQKILNFGLRIGYFDQWNAPKFTGAFDPSPACAVDFATALEAQVSGASAPCPGLVVDVFVACEQSLDPSNRVRLIDERDRFGWRRIALDWRLSKMDVRTLTTAATKAAEAMATYDIGRMKLADWVANGEAPGVDNVWGGNHHMGTTRMSDNPRTGVVDADCKVHGFDNLYIGGSSVFATSGHANPTYSIVQLALRLGDHLRAKT